ncbi:MAG: sigma-70 family RNA polymerase sigma factor [Gemmatimonadetes bacterium]|nr:sigma-70 family RNA polymerase sigma factor [Gemmatimonadota bacterium]MDE3259601.1 sigma-70 family RNA polymerase sigma factor [Gemmatimonadota bacterium]
MTDAELIRRFRDGESHAFNGLAGRWHRRLYNFILRQVGDREEAHDLCQKVLIKAHRNLCRLRDPGKFSTWIYQIAVNTCRDELRRRRRHPTISLESLEHGNESRTDGTKRVPARIDTGIHQCELRDLLNRALQSIPHEQRIVVVMKEYEQLKFTEIAAILNLSVNTVKSRLYNGLNKLKKLLDQWNVNRETIDYEM